MEKEEKEIKGEIKTSKNPFYIEEQFTKWLIANGQKYAVIHDERILPGECYERYMEHIPKKNDEEMER